MPFAEYENFDDCVRHNKDKRDPKAYCGTIQAAVEGNKSKVARLLKTMSLYDRDWFFAEWESVLRSMKTGEPLKDVMKGLRKGKGEDGFEGDPGTAGAGVKPKEDIQELGITKPEESEDETKALTADGQIVDRQQQIAQAQLMQQPPKQFQLHGGHQVTMGEHIDQLHQRLFDAGYGLLNRKVEQDGSGRLSYSSPDNQHKIHVSHDANGGVTNIHEDFGKGLGDVLDGTSRYGGAFCSVCRTATSSYQKCPRCSRTVCRKCYNKHSRSHPALAHKGFPFNQDNRS